MGTKDRPVDEEIGYLEEGNLSIEVANHSQRIITFIQNNNFADFFIE